MCRTPFLMLAVSVAVSVAVSAQTSRAETPLKDHPLVRSNIKLLEAWVESRMAYQGIPGMAIAIVHDQDLLYLRGFGQADVDARRATTPDTLYRIASHSKLFTGIGIMQLRDAGKLSLDDPLSKHLDWFELKGVDPNAPPVTIRQLLTHSSGIPREGGTKLHWSSYDFPTREAIIEHLSSQEVLFPAATRWKYSNLAFILLGEVIRDVSGMSYADYVESRILQPLGMSDSGVTLESIDRSQLAVGYGRRLPDGTRESFPAHDVRGLTAAGGLSSSVRDMARFVSWQFRLRDADEPEVLKPSTLREMQRIHWIDPEWKMGFGLPFIIRKTPARTLVGHSGGLPGFLTETNVSTEEKLGVIVFSNSLDAQHEAVTDRAFDWVGGAIRQAKGAPDAEAPPPHWDALTGTYRSSFWDLHVMPLDGKLVLLTITSPKPKATIASLEPVGDSKVKFRVSDGSPFYPLGESVTFRLDDDGRAESMTYGRMTSRRVK